MVHQLEVAYVQRTLDWFFVCVCVCLWNLNFQSAQPIKCTSCELYQSQTTKHGVQTARTVTAAHYKPLPSCSSSFLTLALQQMNGWHQPWSLYPHYQSDRRLSRLQSQCGCGGEEKNLHPHEELNTELFTTRPTA
jgi:hypothetical protein